MSVLIDATPIKKKAKKREKVRLPISSGVWALSNILAKDIYEDQKGRCREKIEEGRPRTIQRRRSNQTPKGCHYLCPLFSSYLIIVSQSYVNACGVRKVWSKEFQDLDRPSQQVQRLRTILAELGMDGRPSMEKAKEIKEKRALAQELGKWSSSLQRCYGVNHWNDLKRMYAHSSRLL